MLAAYYLFHSYQPLMVMMGMANFVLVAQAAEHSDYSVEHIRYLVRNKFVNSQKVGRIWLVDLDDLQRYEQVMKKAGSTKFTPKSKR
jgi:dephospho-CoA kinase